MPPVHVADESEESRDLQHHHLSHLNSHIHIHHVGSTGHRYHSRSHFPPAFVDEINHAFLHHKSSNGESLILKIDFKNYDSQVFPNLLRRLFAAHKIKNSVYRNLQII